MIEMHDKDRILNFLHSHPMATIATVDEKTSKPESALIAFAELDNLEIIFETFVDTRKYNNLRKNNHVALVVGWDTEHHITLQYEGIAKPITGTDIDIYRNIFLAKDTPCTEEFLLDPRVRLFRVSPTWMALSDYTTGKPVVTELSF
jgi:general stress protein 26